MADVEINGQSYRTGKLSAMMQLHVGRRVLPIVSSLADLLGKNVSTEDFAKLVGPISDAVSKMPDEDVEFIVSKCLGVCSRRQGDSYISVWNASAKAPQFADIELPQMLRLAFEVVKENFATFIPAVSSEPKNMVGTA